MEGAALRQQRDYDAMIAQAWNGAKFNALAQVGKLKSLSTYTSETNKPSAHAGAVAFFHQMKAAGFPVTITRSVRRPAGLQ